MDTNKIKTKSFDIVAEVRKIRNEMAEETKDMTPCQRIEYIRKLAAQRPRKGFHS